MYIEELLTSRLSTYLGFQVSERISLEFGICWSALQVVGGNIFSCISVGYNSYFHEIQIQIISLMKVTQCHKSRYSYEACSRSAKQNKLVPSSFLLFFFFSILFLFVEMEISFPCSEDPVMGLHSKTLQSHPHSHTHISLLP
jgi:hypothetical protein